jgi:hypothetical protein
MSKFAVVVFTPKTMKELALKNKEEESEQETVEVVPVSWLSPAKTHCYWPPAKTKSSMITKLIQTSAERTISWSIWDVRVLAMCGMCKICKLHGLLSGICVLMKT